MTDADGMAGLDSINKNISLSGKRNSEVSISDLQSGMIVQINIYTQCYDLSTQLLAGPEEQPMVQMYTLRYGDKEL